MAILALILGSTAGCRHYPGLIGYWALWLVVIAALMSAADYFRRFNQFLNPRVADFHAARDAQSDRVRAMRKPIAKPADSYLCGTR